MREVKIWPLVVHAFTCQLAFAMLVESGTVYAHDKAPAIGASVLEFLAPGELYHAWNKLLQLLMSRFRLGGLR